MVFNDGVATLNDVCDTTGENEALHEADGDDGVGRLSKHKYANNISKTVSYFFTVSVGNA